MAWSPRSITSATAGGAGDVLVTASGITLFVSVGILGFAGGVLVLLLLHGGRG